MIRFRTYILLFGVFGLMAACAPNGGGEEPPKPAVPMSPTKPSPESPAPSKPSDPQPSPVPIPVPTPPVPALAPAPAPAPPVQPVPHPPPPPKTVYLINGMPAEEFYNHFLLRLAGACDRKDVTYQYPRSYMVKIGVNDQRQDVLAELSIVMKPDGIYRAIYHEVDLWEGPFGMRLWINDRFKVLKGKWSVVKDNIIFENLGMAIGFMNNNRPNLRLKFDQDILFPGIKERKILLTNSVNDHAPFSELNPCDLQL